MMRSMAAFTVPHVYVKAARRVVGLETAHHKEKALYGCGDGC